MKKFLLAAVGLLVLGAPASAADFPATPYKAPPVMMPAMYDWSGLYVGLNGGGGWSRKCWDITNNAGVPVAAPEGCHNATGAMVGGQIGYRLQSAAWVFGIEGQGDWSNFKGTNVSAFSGATNRTTIDNLGLFTGHVGYAWNNILWYVKGGGAFASDRYNGLVTGTGALTDQATGTRWGGVVGTGVEVSFTPDWSFALQYDHAFMGTQNIGFVTVPNGVPTRNDSIRQDIDMVTARINYRWGGPVIPKY